MYLKYYANPAATLRALKPLLASRLHVRRLGYFGSFATGQPGPESDVNILAEFAEPLGWEFFELEELLENALHRKVDLVTPNSLQQQLRRSIMAQIRYIYLMTTPRSYLLYLEDMQEAMERIGRYCTQTLSFLFAGKFVDLLTV